MKGIGSCSSFIGVRSLVTLEHPSIGSESLLFVSESQSQ